MSIRFYIQRCKNIKTILVYKVLYVKFRINSVKQVFLPVNGRKGAMAKRHNGLKGKKKKSNGIMVKGI